MGESSDSGPAFEGLGRLPGNSHRFFRFDLFWNAFDLRSTPLISTLTRLCADLFRSCGRLWAFSLKREPRVSDSTSTGKDVKVAISMRRLIAVRRRVH